LLLSFAVAFIPAVAGALAIAGVLAVASITSVPILAGFFIFCTAEVPNCQLNISCCNSPR
jgi:hypothetical protein